MVRTAGGRVIHVLFIGRPDSQYDKVWRDLQQEGLVIAFARTQTQGLQLARDMKPHIVVVNTTDSHFSGVRLCRLIGSRLPQANRLLIVDQGEGAHIECEERLCRPFTIRKLRDTMRRLTERASPHVMRIGVVQLDLISRVVSSPLGHAHLTPKQCQLLAMFMQYPNQVISREDLMKEIWDTHYLGDTRTLDVHIRWLREKIETDPTHPKFLVTQRGVGYKLIVPAEVETGASAEMWQP